MWKWHITNITRQILSPLFYRITSAKRKKMLWHWRSTFCNWLMLWQIFLSRYVAKSTSTPKIALKTQRHQQHKWCIRLSLTLRHIDFNTSQYTFWRWLVASAQVTSERATSESGFKWFQNYLLTLLQLAAIKCAKFDCFSRAQPQWLCMLQKFFLQLTQNRTITIQHFRFLLGASTIKPASG